MSYAFVKNLTTVNRNISSGREIKYIVIHYTGNKNDTAKANSDYFKSVNRGASAHYFVDTTSVYQVVEDKDIAWSVGKNYGSNNLFGIVNNKNSISIEMCSNDGKISDATFANVVELTKKLMATYNIPINNVVRHFDVCSKRCPGWDGWLPGNESIWNKFKSSLVNNTYRIRKTWTDASSQIGAYSNLNNAIAACKDGYVVFDNNGNVVYTKGTTSTSQSTSTTSTQSVPFNVKIIVDGLNVRKGAGTSYPIVMTIRDHGTYGIVEVNGSWGKLKSGAGWINISSKYVKKV